MAQNEFKLFYFNDYKIKYAPNFKFKLNENLYDIFKIEIDSILTATKLLGYKTELILQTSSAVLTIHKEKNNDDIFITFDKSKTGRLRNIYITIGSGQRLYGSIHNKDITHLEALRKVKSII